MVEQTDISTYDQNSPWITSIPVAETIDWHTWYGITDQNISIFQCVVTDLHFLLAKTENLPDTVGRTTQKEFCIINFEARPPDGATKGQEQDLPRSQRPGGVGHDQFQSCWCVELHQKGHIYC